MTTDDKLAPHPSPWSVVDRGPGSPVEIRDANGQIAFYAPRDRGALIAAAPEMEALLRRAAELVNWLSPFAFAYAAEHPGSNIPTKIDVDDVCRGAWELLARIGATKATT